MDKTKEVAEWILPQHRDKVFLIAAFYKDQPKEFNGWKLYKKDTRWAVYEKNDSYFVILKGTNPKSFRDLHDDLNIALEGPNWVSLIKEGDQIIKELNKEQKKVSVGGHSLGGYSALYLGEQYKLETLALNPAATANAPMMYGAGQDLATTYHVAGDHISSNGNDQYSKIIRADLGYKGHQTVAAHNTDNFFGTTPKALLTQEEERRRNNIDLIYKAVESLGVDNTTPSSTTVGHIYKIGEKVKKVYEYGKSVWEGTKQVYEGGKTAWDLITGNWSKSKSIQGVHLTDTQRLNGLIA